MIISGSELRGGFLDVLLAPTGLPVLAIRRGTLPSQHSGRRNGWSFHFGLGVHSCVLRQTSCVKTSGAVPLRYAVLDNGRELPGLPALQHIKPFKVANIQQREAFGHRAQADTDLSARQPLEVAAVPRRGAFDVIGRTLRQTAATRPWPWGPGAGKHATPHLPVDQF